MKAKKPIAALLGIVVLDQLCLTLTFPLITLIFFDNQSRLFAHDLSYATRSTWYGICVALPNLINVFFAPLLSALSDEFGRKKILMVEVSSAFFFTFLVGMGILLGNLMLVFLGFVVKGTFSRTNPTALAIIGDSVKQDNKFIYMGYLQFAISIGAAFGPILGGYLASRYFFPTFNFSFAFFIAAMIAFLNSIITLIRMPETLNVVSTAKSKRLQNIKEVITQKEIIHLSLILLMIQFSWSMYYQFMPPILKTRYAFDSHQLGWFIGMIACWLAVATSIGIKSLDYFLKLKQTFLLSLYLILSGLILTLLACYKILPFDNYLLWFAAMPIAFGDVVAYSCLTALYSNQVDPLKQGKAMGIVLIVVASTWSTTGFMGGLCMSVSPLLPLLIAPLGVVAALILIHAEYGKKFSSLLLAYH